MVDDGSNPWRKPIMRELAAGRLTVAQAALLASVSRIRVRQWCTEDGVNPQAALSRRLAQFYARELLKMGRKDFSRLPAFMAPLVRRKRKAKGPSKVQQRAAADEKVVDFLAAGGKIRKLKAREPKRRL